MGCGGVNMKINKHCCGCNSNAVPAVTKDDILTDHEKLSGLMGGNANGHYHLTFAALNKVITLIQGENIQSLLKLIEKTSDLTKLTERKEKLEKIIEKFDGADLDKLKELIPIADKLKKLAELDPDELKPTQELSYSIDISASDIANRYIELPEDCDAKQAITVTLNNVHQHQGEAWELIEYTAPQKDRISWRGLDMLDVIQTGDTMCITYHSKK